MTERVSYPTPTGTATNVASTLRRRNAPSRSLVLAAIALALLLMAGGVALLLKDRDGGSAVATGGGTASQAPAADASGFPARVEARPVPKPSATPSAPAAKPTPSTPPPLTYDVRVTYENESIRQGLFRDTLSWQVDVCSPDAELLSTRNLARVRLYLRSDGRWVRQPADARASRGGRCGKGAVNLTIPQVAAQPSDPIPGGWTPCARYRVILPETSKFAKTFVDMCQQVRANVG
jgi:hypothetical protein